jgi:hypothetical protein|tara:strand:- start:26373 stop:26498 length:126 start_codon:yes stop_codon:yes gene_type:complete
MKINIELDDHDTADKYIERLLTVLERIADALEDEAEGSDDG